MCCEKSTSSFCAIGNLLLSISIVLVNKQVYIYTHFPNITLTFVHFLVTSLGIKLCERFNIFSVKHISVAAIIPLAISFCGFVVFTNLSLQYNSVGTYQILKTLTMPTIIVIQTLMYHRKFSWRIKATLVPIIIGACLSSAFDIKFNILGTSFALIGVVITSFYQVWVGEKQKELQVNSMQLLYYQAPLSCLFLLICIPFFEPPWITGGIFLRHYTIEDCILIMMSGIIAFLVNLSIYWLIGNTSALTYNMIGQFKFCLTLIGGYFLFHEYVSAIQFLGISITMAGVYAYAKIKTQEQHSSLPYTIVKS